ncbi:MAG: sigma-70 family RNA polymerase sigma factor [Acidobacteria bacterium]|nr:sigma-70 family RNA polymerase sigma factor [Acidobacteriota bacterium]
MILAAAMNPETWRGIDDTIARARRGDRDALTELLAQYHHRLYRFLVRLVQDPATAEDLFQQTWLRVMQKIGSYRSGPGFDTWLFSVAHNLAIDYLRRRRDSSLDVPDETRTTPAERLVSGTPDPLEELLDSERGALLAAAIGELPAIHREVISLRFEEAMKLEQIAQVAGVPLSTVKSRLHRALESLRARVEASG